MYCEKRPQTQNALAGAGAGGAGGGGPAAAAGGPAASVSRIVISSTPGGSNRTVGSFIFMHERSLPFTPTV